MTNFFERSTKVQLAGDITNATVTAFTRGAISALILEGAGYSLVTNSCLVVGGACALGAALTIIPSVLLSEFVSNKNPLQVLFLGDIIEQILIHALCVMAAAAVGAVILNFFGVAVGVSAVATTALVFPVLSNCLSLVNGFVVGLAHIIMSPGEAKIPTVEQSKDRWLPVSLC